MIITRTEEFVPRPDIGSNWHDVVVLYNGVVESVSLEPNIPPERISFPWTKVFGVIP